MTEPAPTHCGRVLVEVGALRACPACRHLFRVSGANAALEELACPFGVRARWRGAADAPGSYRDAATPGEAVLVVERFWLARWALAAVFVAFVACFLTLVGGIMTAFGLGILAGYGSRETAILVGPLVLALASGLAYVAAALVANRTTITFSGARITRTDGPVPWRGRPPTAIDRQPGDAAQYAEVAQNDGRNLGWRLPAPKVHQVAITRNARDEALVVVEQIDSAADASSIRELVAALLDASAAS